MDVFEVIMLFLGWVATICLAYMLRFDHGYDYRGWEENDDGKC